MKKVILNRPKRLKKSPMKKNTHSIPDLEGLINEKLHIMQNGATMDEKKKARKEVLRLEKMLKDIDYKAVNGKHYPERLKGLPDDKPMNKKELFKLIDSVNVPATIEGCYLEDIITRERKSINIELS